MAEPTAETLLEELRTLRQLAAHVEDVFWISTPDKSQMLYVSPAYEKTFCRSCQTLYDDPKSFADSIHPDDRQRLFDWLPQQGRGPAEIQYRIVRPTGAVRWIWTRTFPVFDEQGQVYRVAGITRDITTQKLAEDRLLHEEQLLRKLLQLQDRERKLVAHDIHDGLVQFVTGAKMVVEGLRHQVQTGGRVKPDDLTAVADMLSKAISEGRRLISDLRPMIIDDEGLIEAINYLVAEETGKGLIAISFTHAVTFERLPSLMENTLFRIVQEALTNIRRHSKARRADIRMLQDKGEITLEIRDDGCGFDPQRIPEDRLGVRGIVERARLFGGEARIKSEPGRGTLLTVRLPLDVLEME
jgi:PAS domain S-box-containing protein